MHCRVNFGSRSGVAARVRRATSACHSLLLLLSLAGARVHAQAPPPYQRDRGPGVGTSMFGTYVRQGELLIYPFVEWYADHDLEYKPSELGHGLEQDYRGRYRATEGLLFLGYGLSRNLALEVEAAVISASLRKSASDPSSMPPELRQSGLGDVEGQIRWRWQEETATRPEGFAYLETVFPAQKRKLLIATTDWEYAAGVGLIRGYGWGTMTLRVAAEYSKAERKVDAGEYAIEYLKRLTPRWRVVVAVEGSQLDEVALITEVQWHAGRHAFVKLNNGFGLTPNATDIAPEFGVLFSLGR